MELPHEDLGHRMQGFAIRIITLYSSLPRTVVAQTIGKQLLRSGTSSGAQYAEAHRAKSDADFISKLEGALQELEETRYWIGLLSAASIITQEHLDPLDDEARQLLAILATIVIRTKARRRKG